MGRDEELFRRRSKVSPVEVKEPGFGKGGGGGGAARET